MESTHVASHDVVVSGHQVVVSGHHVVVSGHQVVVSGHQVILSLSKDGPAIMSAEFEGCRNDR